MIFWKKWQSKSIGQKLCDIVIGSFLVYCVGVIIAWIAIVIFLMAQGQFAKSFMVLVGPPLVIGAIIGVGQEWQS